MTLKVEGLRELRKALRGIDKDAPREITRAHREVAKLIVPAARQAAPRQSGDLAASIRAGGTQKTPTVTVGGTKVAYAYPQEFGGTVPLFGGPRVQIKPFRRQGYFLFPAIRSSEGKIREAYLTALDRAIARFRRP